VIAGRIVANAEGAADWNAVLLKELLGPLRMKNSMYTADAIKAAANHAKVIAMHLTAVSKCLSIRSSLMFLEEPATSTPMSKRW
jgi:hypothetical protein